MHPLQVLLLNTMKDVSSSFADFIILAKNAHNVPPGHPARDDLKNKARVELESS